MFSFFSRRLKAATTCGDVGVPTLEVEVKSCFLDDGDWALK